MMVEMEKVARNEVPMKEGIKTCGIFLDSDLRSSATDLHIATM